MAAALFLGSFPVETFIENITVKKFCQVHSETHERKW